MGSEPSDPKPRRHARTGTLKGVGSEIAKLKAAAKESAQRAESAREASARGEPTSTRLASEARPPRPGRSAPPPRERGEGLDTSLPPFDELADESATLTAGQIVAGKFALIRLVAEGGIAQVFEAEDTLVGRRVALKVLANDMASMPDVVRRFRREAHATALVAHPNVVTVFEIGRRGDGALYIAEELLQGPTVEEHRKAKGRLTEEETLRIVTPIAAALATAHGLGVVHRDVKPSNIILASTSYGSLVPKLIDFGVARMQGNRARGRTLVGTLLGTASYMSPEQALGEAWVDGRTDVWALATVAYELMTGACPFDGPNDHAVLARLLAEPAPRIEARGVSISAELAALIHAGLERDAAKRPSMSAFSFELAKILVGGNASPFSWGAAPSSAAEAPDPRASQL
ncbi:MAG TPA: serine/threonine-protein kinase, partial [Polyangiaceae bacterium]|nr:serine/threonine-protein kinase [Polyangiaceae bacterium]